MKPGASAASETGEFKPLTQREQMLVDGWKASQSEVERLRLAANSARVLIERHRATRGSNDLLSTALRELDDALTAPSAEGRAMPERETDTSARAREIRAEVERRMCGRFSPTDRIAVEQVLDEILTTAFQQEQSQLQGEN